MISPPIALKHLIAVDNSEIPDGFVFSIGFVNQRQNPDINPGYPQVPIKPWMALVHELPARANIWWKHFETLEDAVNDALICGLLTAAVAEMFRQNHRCVDGKTIIFCGVTKAPRVITCQLRAQPHRNRGKLADL